MQYYLQSFRNRFYEEKISSPRVGKNQTSRESEKFNAEDI